MGEGLRSGGEAVDVELKVDRVTVVESIRKRTFDA